MRRDIEKRLEYLENARGNKPLVPISFQWLASDGVPSSPVIRRMVPQDRFGWLNETRS